MEAGCQLGFSSCLSELQNKKSLDFSYTRPLLSHVHLLFFKMFLALYIENCSPNSKAVYQNQLTQGFTQRSGDRRRWVYPSGSAITGCSFSIQKRVLIEIKVINLKTSQTIASHRINMTLHRPCLLILVKLCASVFAQGKPKKNKIKKKQTTHFY